MHCFAVPEGTAHLIQAPLTGTEISVSGTTSKRQRDEALSAAIAIPVNSSRDFRQRKRDTLLQKAAEATINSKVEGKKARHKLVYIYEI